MNSNVFFAGINLIGLSILLMMSTPPPEKLWPLFLWTLIVAVFGMVVGSQWGK